MLLMCITRMPRLCTPMKDVASCEKLRSAARQALSAEDLRMGKPTWGNAHVPDSVFDVFCSSWGIFNYSILQFSFNTQVPMFNDSNYDTYHSFV
jgi:hypothetical protein